MKGDDWPLGCELKARRLTKGWTQRQLAEAAGIGRTAVQYWEAAFQIDPMGWAVCRMADALAWKLPRPDYRTETRPRGDRLIDRPGMMAFIEAQIAAANEREAARAARRRIVCGAKTRKGTPCRNKSEPGKKRCKFHGGKSTGARTPEGIERIREAQRRRWAKPRQAP